ncbi:MAG TPA: L,D-transpeptidase family protein [Alphaproteobacteria bacterium]
MAAAAAARAETPEIVPVPPHRGEEALAAGLDRYRQIQARGGWPVVPSGPTLRIGDSGPRVAALRSRLAADPDLPADTGSAADGDRFDGGLAQAVLTFQHRHGLDPDAAVGRATLAALNVPVERRIAQIELNMKRLEALPAGLEGGYAAVNIADQRLMVVDGDAVALLARVIVGKPSTRTPVLASRIDSVVFNPPWNVPVSIARNEILPRLRRDPGYLARENMIILGRPDDPYGRRIDWTTAALGQFAARLRQLPGDRNALGRIKFEFPNPYSVYLHDTPAKALFQRTRRLFSHGCIRVENPRALALHLLSPQGWDMARIEAAIEAGATRRVSLARPMPIVVLYLTAFADASGAIQFRDDVYGWDAVGRTFDELRRQDVGGATLAAAGCTS